MLGVESNHNTYTMFPISWEMYKTILIVLSYIEDCWLSHNVYMYHIICVTCCVCVQLLLLPSLFYTISEFTVIELVLINWFQLGPVHWFSISHMFFILNNNLLLQWPSCVTTVSSPLSMEKPFQQTFPLD